MRRRSSLFVLGLLIAPLAAQSPALRLEVPFQQFKLANGLNVILHQDRSVPIATVNIWYHVGSANEKPGRTGFAHLFEHIMFEGSKNVQEGEFDSQRPDQLLHRRASERARAGALPGFGPYGLPARRDVAGPCGRPARRGQERTPSEL